MFLLANSAIEFNSKIYIYKYIMETFTTPYGLVTLLPNDVYVTNEFRRGLYWDEHTMLKLKQYIHPNRNILEIGGHCGTSSLVYSSFISDSKQIHVYEPQKHMYAMLVKNIEQNNLQNKIIPYHSAVFCYKGVGEMHSMDLDGGDGVVAKAYDEKTPVEFNFAGVGLGQDGEEVAMTTVDLMGLDDIGFIHCDAQGAENFIFSKAIETIKRDRPVILYENNFKFAKHYHDVIFDTYTQYEAEGLFNVSDYCMKELGYSTCIDRFNGGIDTLLIP